MGKGCFIIKKNRYSPNMILFNDGKEDVTVSMALEVLEHMIDLISLRMPIVGAYKKAITVLKAMKMILNNNTPSKISKNDMKTVVEVIEEVKNSYAKSEEEKRYNAEMAFKCKLIIEMHY